MAVMIVRLNSLVLAAVLCLALVFLGGCTVAELSPADTLRFQFPEQADRVLVGEAAFSAIGDSFRVERRAGAGPRLDAELPLDGAAPVRFQSFEGFELQVREVGLDS